MSMLNLFWMAGLSTILSCAVCAADAPNLGKPISEADVRPWDISVAPDGGNLPSGQGTVKRGEEVYIEKCAACHGFEGSGQPADALVGGKGSLTTETPIKTVGSFWPYATTLFDYVRRAMPLNEPQSLSNDDVYAVSAYILHLNGIIGARETMNANTLPQVQMPNRDNFFIVYPNDLK